MIVDTHCHASTRWYEPVESLLHCMDRNHVDKAVLISLLGSFDSADMIAAAAHYPDRLIWFAAIDPESPDALDAVRTAHDAGARGLRMRAGWRSPGEAPMAIWEQADASGMAVSLVGPAASFVNGALSEVASHCPKLTLILEHLGGLGRPDVGNRGDTLPAILDLARFPNLTIKLPGLGQLAPRKAVIDGQGVPLDLDGVEDLVGAVLGSFGRDRVMWGSDFLPVATREGYDHALGWTGNLLDRWGAETRAAVLGETAAALLL